MKTSFKEVETFTANTKNVPVDKFISVIQNYNDHALFSSSVEREVSQSDAHLHFMLKEYIKLRHKIGRVKEYVKHGTMDAKDFKQMMED